MNQINDIGDGLSGVHLVLDRIFGSYQTWVRGDPGPACFKLCLHSGRGMNRTVSYALYSWAGPCGGLGKYTYVLSISGPDLWCSLHSAATNVTSMATGFLMPRSGR